MNLDLASELRWVLAARDPVLGFNTLNVVAEVLSPFLCGVYKRFSIHQFKNTFSRLMEVEKFESRITEM